MLDRLAPSSRAPLPVDTFRLPRAHARLQRSACRSTRVVTRGRRTRREVDMAAQTKLVPGFLPSTSGLHFTNRFPSGIPIETISILVVDVNIPLGDASNGVC